MCCAICMDQSFLITTDVIAVYLVLFIRNSDKYIIISYFLLTSCTYNNISFQKLNLALISALPIRAPTFSSCFFYFFRGSRSRFDNSLTRITLGILRKWEPEFRMNKTRYTAMTSVVINKD